MEKPSLIKVGQWWGESGPVGYSFFRIEEPDTLDDWVWLLDSDHTYLRHKAKTEGGREQMRDYLRTLPDGEAKELIARILSEWQQ